MTGPPTTFPVDEVFCLVAKEVTPGTGVAGVATLGTPKPVEWNDKPTWLKDVSLRGVMGEGPFGVQQGVTLCELTFPESPLYPDTFGYVAGNLMGDVATTGSAAPYSTAISLLNSASGQGTTHTFTQYYGPTASVGTRTFAGTVFSEVSIMWDVEKKLLTWSGKAVSWMSVVAGAKPTNNQTAVTPIPSWRLLTGYAGPASGGTQDLTCAKGKITMKRKVKPFYTGMGSQNPYSMQRAALGATFDGVQWVAGDESKYSAMSGNTLPQLQFVFTNGLTGASQTGLQIDAQQSSFQKSPPEWGSDLILWNTSGEFVFNSTNAGASGGTSPLKLTLTNALASGTYV